MAFNYSLEEHEALLSLIANAIPKSIGADIKHYLANSNNETNNAVKFMRADFINTNVKNALIASMPNIKLHAFKRGPHDLRLIVDFDNHLTYSIHGKTSFDDIRNRHQDSETHKPHYTQSILAIENQDIAPVNEQLSLLDFGLLMPYSEDEYQKDYADIVGQDGKIDSGFHNIVITYSCKKGKVDSLDLLILAYDMSVVEEFSLMDLIHPDIMELTDNIDPDNALDNIPPDQSQPKETPNNLVKLKVSALTK